MMRVGVSRRWFLKPIRISELIRGSHNPSCPTRRRTMMRVTVSRCWFLKLIQISNRISKSSRGSHSPGIESIMSPSSLGNEESDSKPALVFETDSLE
jgi:hypothetical protein